MPADCKKPRAKRTTAGRNRGAGLYFTVLTRLASLPVRKNIHNSRGRGAGTIRENFTVDIYGCEVQEAFAARLVLKV
jgi:hypothetical protein